MEKEEFLKLLPKLIREDDEVKGAIITALSGVVATKDDITRLIEHSDRRFEAMQRQMDERFESLQKQIDQNYKILNFKIDNLGSRAGRGLEELIIKVLKEQQKIKDIEFSEIKREDLVDDKGYIFPKGTPTDIDVLVRDGKTILIEIKFKLDQWDLHHFYEVSQLYEKKIKKPDELWALTLEISPKTLEHLTRYPIKLIYGIIKE